MHLGALNNGNKYSGAILPGCNWQVQLSLALTILTCLTPEIVSLLQFLNSLAHWASYYELLRRSSSDSGSYDLHF